MLRRSPNQELIIFLKHINSTFEQRSFQINQSRFFFHFFNIFFGLIIRLTHNSSNNELTNTLAIVSQTWVTPETSELKMR